jgi:hypothetical protein
MVCALNGQFGTMIGQARVIDCKTRRHNGNIMDHPQAPMPPKRNNLMIPDTQRTAIMQFLLKRTHPDTGQLMRGTKKAAASHFDVHRNTIYTGNTPRKTWMRMVVVLLMCRYAERVTVEDLRSMTGKSLSRILKICPLSNDRRMPR